jgi:hypothetical protein
MAKEEAVEVAGVKVKAEVERVKEAAAMAKVAGVAMAMQGAREGIS